jgi:hypothetical protein
MALVRNLGGAEQAKRETEKCRADLASTRVRLQEAQQRVRPCVVTQWR